MNSALHQHYSSSSEETRWWYIKSRLLASLSPRAGEKTLRRRGSQPCLSPSKRWWSRTSNNWWAIKPPHLIIHKKSEIRQKVMVGEFWSCCIQKHQHHIYHVPVHTHALWSSGKIMTKRLAHVMSIGMLIDNENPLATCKLQVLVQVLLLFVAQSKSLCHHVVAFVFREKNLLLLLFLFASCIIFIKLNLFMYNNARTRSPEYFYFLKYTRIILDQSCPKQMWYDIACMHVK